MAAPTSNIPTFLPRPTLKPKAAASDIDENANPQNKPVAAPVVKKASSSKPPTPVTKTVVPVAPKTAVTKKRPAPEPTPAPAQGMKYNCYT